MPIQSGCPQSPTDEPSPGISTFTFCHALPKPAFISNFAKISAFYLHSTLPHSYRFLLICALVSLLTGCSATRFLPEGKNMLTRVRLISDNPQVRARDYRDYVRQEPNSRWLSTVKVPLGIYCLSGTSESNLFNRIIHRIGEAPVVFNDTLMRYSTAALTAALRSKGYLQAQTEVKTIQRGRRMQIVYILHPGNRSYVHELVRKFDNDAIRSTVMADSAHSLLYKGMPLDVTTLSDERTRIIRQLQNSGYVNINNEFITFAADTLLHSQAVRLTMHLSCPRGADATTAYRTYRIGHIRLSESATGNTLSDTTFYRGITFIADRKPHINRHVYFRNLFIRPDSLYRDFYTRFTYQNLNALGAVSSSVIHYSTPTPNDSTIDADLFVQLNKSNTVSLDIEGTNTAGDLGGAATFSYTHRNLFHGAESLILKFRGAYEAIRRLEGYNNQNYTEYGVEATLRLPNLPLSPGERYLLDYRGNTDLSLLYNSQNRPEFYRRLLTAMWSVDWNRHARPNMRHHWDILSFNYVFMPWISDTFRKEYLEGDNPRYAVLRYSYENLFIMSSTYRIIFNSRHQANTNRIHRNNEYQIRAGVETAGNLLYGISKMLRMRRNTNGTYAILNIPYSQYVKADFDFSKSFRFSDVNSLAFHLAAGIAIPYGNSSVIPYEKRYFSGGANSVRGWNVRALGPGRYAGKDGNIDFINQTGNVKFDLSLEYRSSLFWKFEGAAFIDAGNIWITKNHNGVEGGQFKFDSFWKEIAVAYGLGLRLNLNYFIIRLDGGMKAINPSIPAGSLHYPLIHPRISRDLALHFAVGLPF